MVRETNAASFAVRAKIADSRFPMNSMSLERELGRAILEHLRALGRSQVRVNLNAPELTCNVEIIPGSALIYTRRIEGPGGLPATTGGALVCLLSGGFDSAVAAYKMMRRGSHVSFVHFFATQARDSSVPVAKGIIQKLTPYQLTSRLYLVPFERIRSPLL